MVLGLAVMPSPASAQTGQIKGKVARRPEDSRSRGPSSRSSRPTARRSTQLKTNKKGEYIQIGLPPGQYTVTAEKDALKQQFPTRVGLDMTEVNFKLEAGIATTSGMSKEEAAKAAAKVEAVEDGLRGRRRAQQRRQARRGDREVQRGRSPQVPKCTECYANIGVGARAKKDYAQAEAAYKKAIEINPEFAEAYNGLATVYNDQKKFDRRPRPASAEARQAAMRRRAGGAQRPTRSSTRASSPGTPTTSPRRRSTFEAAVKADPNHAGGALLARAWSTSTSASSPEAAKPSSRPT